MQVTSSGESTDAPVTAHKLLVPVQLAKDYIDKDMSAEFLIEHDEVIEANDTNVYNYDMARVEGMRLGAKELSTLHIMYHSNEQQRAAIARETGIPLADLDGITDPYDPSLKKYVEALQSRDDAPRQQDPAHIDKVFAAEEERMYRHIHFSDAVPPDEAYRFRNEGEVVAWIDKGKIRIHAAHIEKKF
jgi:hypothetical protein